MKKGDSFLDHSVVVNFNLDKNSTNSRLWYASTFFIIIWSGCDLFDKFHWNRSTK